MRSEKVVGSERVRQAQADQADQAEGWVCIEIAGGKDV